MGASVVPCVHRHRRGSDVPASMSRARPMCAAAPDIRYSSPIMSRSHPPRARLRPLMIPGLSALSRPCVDTPPAATARRIAICVIRIRSYGGTMTNKVVHMLAKSFNERRRARACDSTIAASARVRARTTKATAKRMMRWPCCDWAAQRWPGARLWLGGVLVRRRGGNPRRSCTRARRRRPDHRRAGRSAASVFRHAAAAVGARGCSCRATRMNWWTPPDIQRWAAALAVTAAARHAAGRGSFLSWPPERLARRQ